MLLLATTAAAEESWDRHGAARYLDARAELWMTQSRAEQKVATACVSCHTAMPYLLGRASLSPLPPPATALYGDVEARVRGWRDAKVWYDTDEGEDKPSQSWGTESVINALVLTTRDREADGGVSEEAKAALEHMWERQSGDGGWPWLHFELGPWEADGANYWGTSLAAVAAMSAAQYVKPPVEGIAKLRSYLRAGLSKDLMAHNRLGLLWAASAWDGLLSEAEKQRLVAAVVALQQEDGGFRIVDLGPWPSEDGTPPSQLSDGYATAFTTFVLQRADEPSAAPAVARGVAWLEQNQQADGRWETSSPNLDRSQQEAFRRLLMSDAATGFAVLALTPSSGEPRATEP